jgi:hypothetical protein
MSMLVFLFSHIEHLNRQRQAVVLVLALKFLYPHRYRNIHSPFYHEPRTQDLYQNYMMNQWDDTQFKEYFRMDKASFHDLCERLAPLLEGGHTNYKESLSVQKKVAVSLSRLAGEVVPYRVHAMIFGIAPSTACKVFKDFVFAVIAYRGTFLGFKKLQAACNVSVCEGLELLLSPWSLILTLLICCSRLTTLHAASLHAATA